MNAETIDLNVDDEATLRAEFQECASSIRTIDGLDWATIEYENFKIALSRAVYRYRKSTES